jgi:hypothetical protein
VERLQSVAAYSPLIYLGKDHLNSAFIITKYTSGDVAVTYASGDVGLDDR